MTIHARFRAGCVLAAVCVLAAHSTLAESPGKKPPKNPPSPPATFATPLFGLAAAPNGQLLAADAGSGILALLPNARLLAPLPGVTDVSAIGSGALWATRTGSDQLANTGQALLRVSKGKTRLVADLFAFEEKRNPDGEVIESNPFDVQALDGGAALVADAAGNVLLRVNNQGRIRVLAVFPRELVSTANVKSLVGCPDSGHELCGLPPMLPAQGVPTSIAIGLDGNYYVGELKGFPAPTGASNIWRVSPWAHNATCGVSPDCELVFQGGFTSIIDLAFDRDGILHVVEFDEQSWFAVEVLGGGAGGTINACDIYTGGCAEVASGIPMVTAIAFDRKGQLWATRNALIPGVASVFKVQ